MQGVVVVFGDETHRQPARGGIEKLGPDSGLSPHGQVLESYHLRERAGAANQLASRAVGPIFVRPSMAAVRRKRKRGQRIRYSTRFTRWAVVSAPVDRWLRRALRRRIGISTRVVNGECVGNISSDGQAG